MNDDVRPVLAFSTLGCPEWDAKTVAARAAALGYDGIEWRGGPDGTVRTSWTVRERVELRDALARSGIQSVAVTSYPNLISGDPAARRRSADHIRDHVDLARDLGASAVRVFLGIADDAAPPEVLTGRAIDGLAAALDHARAAGIRLAIEPHDGHVQVGAIQPILAALAGSGVGVAWDIANAWAAGEAPGIGLAAYAGRIVYVQVKDGTGRGERWQLCGLGDGEVPIAAAVANLVALHRAAGTPLPPISVEWERAWHPELAAADVALPRARTWLTHLLGSGPGSDSIDRGSRDGGSQ